ncbi:hypothetical protein IV454_07965 [Massilia antarctica]|uniref:HEAT repeat domain-containing protein n=1 Tax=Massilia antarctica TaxID=2765360 RepID=A0AA49AA73_9BURK|nr:hypothetical protein [Massilia antarctica]QPI51440.1 hypothetical protein IV454_07965 [Massilia antarctica]
MTTLPIPRIIAPLIRRHAEDAAFYWALLDGSVITPRLSLDGLTRFGDMLDAHLEGLQVAGQDGLVPCLAALERWRKAAGAFVYAHQVFCLNEPVAMEALLVQVRARPEELLRGVISALAWRPPEQVASIVRRWTGADVEVIQQVAALRAAALLDANAVGLLGQPVEDFLYSSDAHICAAACRVAATVPHRPLLEAALTRCIVNPAMAVRAEAAIALHALARQAPRGNDEGNIALANTVWQCVVEQVVVSNESTGWYRHQALRRLRRWVRNLATMIPLGHDKIPALLDFMPPRISLHFVAYHGDSAHLAYAIAKMSHPDTSRYAGWVWQTITGVDLESAGLTLPEPALSGDSAGISEARSDADHGLPLPDMEAIARYSTAHLPARQRCLSGQGLTPLFAVAVLETAPQAHRSVASHFLRQCYPQIKLAPRGRIEDQLATIKQLRRLLIDEEVR